MKILALSPHTDDVEIGAGATLAKWIERGHRVHSLAFSTGNLKTGALPDEFCRSMRLLRVYWHLLLDYDARRFPDQRQRILDYLVEFREEIKPDLVLIPAPWHIHQDHQVIAQEAMRAFRFCTIYGYEQPYNSVDRGGRLQHFEPVSEEHLKTKLGAIACYRSQLECKSSGKSLICSLARVRGLQCGHEFAEAFQVVRSIGGL